MLSARRFAMVAAGSSAALLVVSVVMVVGSPTRATVIALLLGLAVSPPAAVLGVLVSRRAPVARLGALLAWLGLAVALVVARDAAAQVAVDRGVVDSVIWIFALLEEGAWWVEVVVALLLLYFPDARLPSPRWRWVPPALVLSVLVVQGYGAVDPAPFRAPLEDVPRPFGAPPLWLDVLSLLAFILMLGLVLASVVSVALRYRHADPRQRLQIRWLGIVGFGMILYPFLCLLEIVLWGRPLWFSGAVGVAALVGVPVATAIAILKHDLVDVDKALAGAVAWGLVTLTLLGVYALVSLAAGIVAGGESTTVAAATAAVCALALLPLRRRVQHAVDRRLYPRRRAAFEAVDHLHRDASAGTSRPEELEDVLRAALRDPELRVGFRVPGAERFVDVDGAMVDASAGTPVELAGVQIGVIVAARSIASPELLRQVASRATTMVEVVRLRLELAGALRDVEASRARLVQVGFEERRRLERDLHDGAQQRLVSLGMAIRLAQRHLDDGTIDVNGLLDQSVAELGTAVAELRQIAHGLRPSSLDDGLPAALARLVRSVPLRVEMDVAELSLPDDVATTAYYVISEALANTVKHAGASTISLRVRQVDSQVVVTISDDGRGGATVTTGSRLADRVAALGGSLQVASPAGLGTVVEAALPCAS